jgi:phosphopantothenoylcysteine decarboxylase/phosphopantothenate--cysteine ligase
VADYAPASPVADKIAKTDAPLTITLERTRDILADLGRLPGRAESGRPVLVGFAAETGDAVEKARQKRVRKQADLIVANDVSQDGVGFDVATNAVTIVGDDGEQVVPLQSKDRIAAIILDRIEQHVVRQPQGTSRIL